MSTTYELVHATIMWQRDEEFHRSDDRSKNHSNHERKN